MPFDGVAAACGVVASAWRAGLLPPPRRGPGAWADAERRLGSEEGPVAGRWSTALTPYLAEPMDAMGLDHPAERVTFVGSSQIGKTQCGLNMLGQIAAERPCPVMMVLPSIDEARSYNREKLQPMIDNTPAVRGRAMDVKRADEAGSTTMLKRFPGGSIELVGANSSKGLQMRTKRVVLMEEVSEFPFDVDGRGDPVLMAEARTIAYRKRREAKIIKISTPGTKGTCRITAAYDEGSRGLFHVPCPHCDAFQALRFDRLVYDTARPHLAQYACIECGALAQESDKAGMLARGRWVHEHPDRLELHASYRVNALYSPFVTWGWVAAEREKSRDDQRLDKVFIQQVMGEAYEPTFDVVPHQVLWERRTEWRAGRIPAGVLFLEGATDVQGDRLEWAVYGFDRFMGQWWLDGGVIAGDPRQAEVWAEHDAIVGRRWMDAWGRDWPAESWGIDTGYLTQDVYRYVRRHAAKAQPRIMALDGRPKWGEPPIGTPKTADVDYNGRKIGSVRLWPVGTWDLKSELAAAMMLTQQGPDETGTWPRGSMRFPTMLDLGFFEQLTAEAVSVRETRNGYDVREWVRIRARNEQLDLAVYARALARHDTARFTVQDWDNLTARRVEPRQPDLVDLIQSPLALEAATPPAAVADAAVVRTSTTGRIVGGVGRRLN